MLQYTSQRWWEIVRAMPLEGVVIQETLVRDAKYPHMFDVHNLNYKFMMRAKDDTESPRYEAESPRYEAENPRYEAST